MKGLSPLLLLLNILTLDKVVSQLGPCDRTRRVLTAPRGVLSTGPIGANYTQDSHCEWLIKSNSSTERFISLTFRSMGTECAYDYVFVYDGSSFNAPLLGSFSGRTAPPRVTAASGSMLLLLYSDTNYVLDGFRAEYTISACPGNCTGRGYCLKGRCICNDAQWGGPDCSRKLCPNECGKKERHGQCDKGHCICRSGYSGRSCSLPEKSPSDGRWHYLAQTGEGLRPRAAHSAVYVGITDALYVFGGYDLNHVLADLEVYNFQTNSWRDSNGNELIDWELVDRVDPAEAARFIAQQSLEGLGLPQNSLVSNIFYALGDNSSKFLRRQRHSGGLAEEVVVGPRGRYGHSGCAAANGFVLYGGKLKDGNLSDQLWYYDVQTRLWHLRAQFSVDRPPKLTRHTLTCVNNTIYLFGGSTPDGEFSSQLWQIKLHSDFTEQWAEVHARGGKPLDIRVVAHTTVHHRATNSLIVYGGIAAGVARFSKLSDKMFAFQLDNKHWTEIHYTREHLREKFVPRERAFHSANVFGNYLVIFGGYSHRHNKEEICYDNQMYLYHLGCHTWVNPDILGSHNESRYPKQQGVFAHASSVRNDHTLVIVGGYHGNVNGDLLAWTAPPALRSIPPSACSLHVSFGACSADPECGWCSADDRCYGRTVGANCTTNLQTARCPGVCPALQDCHSCLVHGHLHGTEESSSSSASYRLGLGECAWCVQNARCHPKDDPHGAGACGAQEDSPSQIPGWWGPKGTEIRQPQDCAALDHRPGLTFIKYNHPANFSQPDHVTTLNATTIDFNGAAFLPARIDGLGGQVVANLLGFLRLPIGWRETLNICASHSVTTVTLADTLVCNITTVERNCTSRPWPEDLPEGRIPINYQSVKTVGQLYTPHQQSRMELQHSKPEETPKVFTFEYLEPFANGTCSQYTNCLHCLTDSQCGWCELTNTCRSRTDDEQETCALDGDWRYLTIQPGMCPNCSNFISCTSCVATGICEWWIEEARCTRMGQKPGSVIEASECPTPCYMRSGCDSCLDQRGRCVWCQATQKCFSFSVYTSEYQFGLCREWLDQAFPLITTHENSSLAPKSQEQCKACAAHTNCSACLGALSCGWCHDASNPMSGMCVRGDFQRPETSCSEVLGGKEAKWAYAQCPDVDECGLGLHDCHPQADCINTDGSFSCHCRKGYIGDGRSSCVRTCYNVCVHGSCQGEPEYKCSCDVGWYGDDCSRNCGCNNHSACPEGYQICDQCQDHTMGKYCEYCRPGSFGNATTEQGCRPCECNGHGDSDKGECDIETGECFCQDNTEGLHCERCKPNYSGDPRNGQQCYYQCEARGVLTEPKGQGISSLQNLNPPHGGPPIGECLWIIKPDVDYGTPIIQLQINSTQLNVTCGENAVYVYDGLPELVDMGSQSALSAVFCTQEALPTAIVESRTGHLTVHYKQGPPNESFSAVYKVISCDACESPRECRDGKCVCQEGFVGPNCYEEICPRNCSSAAGRGSCDANYGRCLCNEGWTGQDCSIAETKLQLVFIELFNTERLAVGLDHLRKTLPRFGHSLVSDRRGSLWMFGGYSLSHGPLNDVRLFDTKNISWIQVTVESTPDARMPQGRYFHGADIVHSKQAIFVYGGLTKPQKNLNNRTLNDFWQFDIPNQRWDEIESPYANVKLPSAYWVTDWPPALYGHTLTYYRNADRDESLILIGGDSPNHGFLNVIWEYSIDKNVWTKIMSKGNGPAGIFGHSTVFHSQTNSLYVFGGYVYEKQMSVMSNSLYRLEYETKTWIELTGGNSGYVPKPRFFHSAVTTDHYMLILGGRIYPWNISDTLYAFSYNCNQWINLMTESVEKIGPHPKQTYAQAMTIEPDGDAAYVIGGWDIDTHTSVLKIELPMDICNLFSTKTTCLRVPGCGYCANKNGDDIVTQICHRNTLDCPLDSTGNTVRISNSGRICEGQYIGGNCSSIKDCGTCSLSPGCVFCNGTDTCVNSIDTECASQICPFRKCVATDCVQCHQLERCEWSYSRRICERTNTTHEAHVIGQCPASCSTYQSCSDCLKIHGCHWSTRLHECLNSASQSVYCAGGTCGLVLESNDPKQCPEPCNAFDQCSSCLRHGNCGWCAAPGDSGKGMCSEGNSERPMKGDCSKVVEEMGSLLEDFVDDQNYTWHYVTCPKENECANGHHSCANGSEICVDLDYGYKCVCGEGYKLGSTGCEPVCPQGCVRGRCVAPSKCECEFGYVGANCSIQCLCHGHSNCEGPDKLDHCIKCHNNTKGDRCEFCEPFFVGDPTNRTACVPCSEYCHGHSNYCVDANSTFSIQRNDYVDVEVLLETLHVGPKGDAVCLRCTDKTTGNRCDECITGNFRGSDVLGDPCRSCDCHGHGTKCHPVTGDQCDCQNNTVSDECSGQGRNSAQPSCWEVQCAKCREGFLGTPTNGRQCYKQMSVDNKMCFNAKPIDECKMPRPLQPGELVFFVIQPRFMNVDIRIVVDVTQGALNVFMSTHDDTYVARPNTTTGINDIELDEIYRPFENGSHRSEDMHIKTEAVGLRTYITVTQPKTILTVRNLTSRLVITLPEVCFAQNNFQDSKLEYHKLENTRFFLVLQSIDEHQPAYGVVFSRQDQLHIDLFVFFSVFFSVFFLFLAACVVAWKAKQAADARHARRRHVVEMLHMAKRPFAGVTLDLTTKTPTGKRNAHHEVRPVAIEPTGDNVAAVATVFVSLPGGQNLPVKLALASSLILLARQFPTSSRMFLRRRSIHAAPPT
ncbi:multiple epidermal growth factor-like domains protein 8 isoform X2 [Sitophilus oryzae]|uniref:Multiple epidermal growth factor-like domains protein 8 isoform X2 n=1 Tax=Sitophilus oryzae TaxID=7048 RepID=A0A6J2YC57_SITOR|nr:multiple epidermal growth factor-like domains protein 8 isoform X2 [Sitophilus oryzae]